MKQGNNNNSCSTCSCDYLQLHLLPAPKSLFSERFNVRVMSIIWFIALVASFSLKYLPISEIKILPMLMSTYFYGGSCVEVAKTEHSHPLGMVVSTHFRCGKGVKRGLKNGALPFTID